MSYDELQTVFYEAAEIVNERPLAIQVSDDSKINYLCANQLLLGRASPRIQSGPFEFSKHPLKRFKLVQEIVDQFWVEWQKLTFPKLVVRGKWHTESRNLQINDVVLVRDENALRSEYRMALVSDVFPDKFGKVRKVEVMYKNIGTEPVKVYKGKPGTTLKRDVRSLVLLLPVEEQSTSLFDN